MIDTTNNNIEKNEELKGLEIKFTCPFCNWESERKPLIGNKISTKFTKEEVLNSYKINESQHHAVFVEIFKKHLGDSDNCFSLFMDRYIKMEGLVSEMLSKKDWKTSKNN
ncbi:MAG: hypothetical protein I3273_07685 [Candidatus Moeniiplasma glomeromycotorum]|nr:hypothetical protein [Candidatus Moeniiplasma glomeromycotorum]MCE8168416.1 hypothetical protein [Candidatus Moeniiplasma glomeromycotorum]MCE8169961.1 hypothetical protein [Candidatus Moeniiplasma glomeromycotorum]